MTTHSAERIAVIGLGYVGLPVALAFARHFPGTIGFDINRQRVEALCGLVDTSGEVSTQALSQSSLRIVSDIAELDGSTFFVVAVPTPVDEGNRPDLGPLIRASELVGSVLRPGSVVVYESTVYPGATEEVCGPALARASGLQQGHDFKLGYSPERINPGDTAHTFDNIIKVVAGEDLETLERVAAAYDRVVSAGIHKASSIKVGEAAKVIENTQRDLNIALMNEIAIICNKLGISTREVLAAARTKWNFLPFTPGLVGGHCIGVDPYYLTHKAEQLGYHPQVILAGRRINDTMGAYVAQSMVKMLSESELPGSRNRYRVGLFGLAFKENVRDIRNSRVPDIIRELKSFSVEAVVHDPLAIPSVAQQEYAIDLIDWDSLGTLDGILLAVPHKFYRDKPIPELLANLRPGGVVFDVKSALDRSLLPSSVRYRAL